MEEESSRFPTSNRSRSRALKRPATVAAVLGIAVFGVGAGFAVSGCGSDSNSDSVNSVIDSVQSQASSVQSQASSVSSQASTAIQSVQSQAQSVQTQIQQNQNGGSGQYGY
jgi:predicted PurR-regulated permease PerM